MDRQRDRTTNLNKIKEKNKQNFKMKNNKCEFLFYKTYSKFSTMK